MLKFEGIAIGTTIKAFDFEPCPGRTDRYIMGKITDITVRDGAKFYVIECTEDSSSASGRCWIGTDIYVPMEMMMDFDDRIIPLDGPCAPKLDPIHKLANKLGLSVVDVSLDKDEEWIATQNMVDR